MINNILFALWFFLPAALANTFASIFRKAPFLNYPVDMGLSYKGKRLLGDNKTIRGFFVGTVSAIIICLLQVVVYNNSGFVSSRSEINYWDTNPFILGGLLGFGAILGDVVESFFKRRLNIAPGKPWFPFDQIDFSIGATITSLPYIILDVKYYLLGIICYFALHLIMKVIGYLVRVDDAMI